MALSSETSINWRRPVGLVAQAASRAANSSGRTKRRAALGMFGFTMAKRWGQSLSHLRKTNAIEGRIAADVSPRFSGKIRGMAACANILPDIRSIYRWRGETRDAGASGYLDWVANETGSA